MFSFIPSYNGKMFISRIAPSFHRKLNERRSVVKFRLVLNVNYKSLNASFCLPFDLRSDQKANGKKPCNSDVGAGLKKSRTRPVGDWRERMVGGGGGGNEDRESKTNSIISSFFLGSFSKAPVVLLRVFRYC